MAIELLPSQWGYVRENVGIAINHNIVKTEKLTYVGYSFSRGSIGRDIKTTVQIRNILFATFSHTFQLLLYIVDAPTQIFFVAWYQLSNTLVIEASRLCFQPILYAGLQLSVPKVLLLGPFHTRKQMKISESQVRADDGG